MAIIGDEESSEMTKKERKRAVRVMLWRALTDMNVRMVSDHQYTSVGLQYTDTFTSYMEVLTAMSLLPWWQRLSLVRNIGPERATQETIAASLGVRRETVCGYISRGLDDMCERIYETHLTNLTHDTEKCATILS